jgi:uncharacterized membrane protein
MRLAALILLPALVLAACSRDERPAAPPAAPAEPAPVLAGVDLTQPVRVLGTEPFWNIDLSGKTMVWTSMDGATASADQPDPVIHGTTAKFEAATADGEAFEVMLIATQCSDGMSDRLYPLVAQVKIGDRSLSGCAASRAALMTAPESGPVEAPAAPAAPQPVG